MTRKGNIRPIYSANYSKSTDLIRRIYRTLSIDLTISPPVTIPVELKNSRSVILSTGLVGDTLPCVCKYSRACIDALRFAMPFVEPCPTPTLTPRTVVKKKVNRRQRDGITLLTDGSYMVSSTMLGPFSVQDPFKISGRIAPIASRVALKEVVEITNRVCHKTIWEHSNLKLQTSLRGTRILTRTLV